MNEGGGDSLVTPNISFLTTRLLEIDRIWEWTVGAPRTRRPPTYGTDMQISGRLTYIPHPDNTLLSLGIPPSTSIPSNIACCCCLQLVCTCFQCVVSITGFSALNIYLLPFHFVASKFSGYWEFLNGEAVTKHHFSPLWVSRHYSCQLRYRSSHRKSCKIKNVCTRMHSWLYKLLFPYVCNL
mgnify:CR=1 FL=1